jgi:transcriptional regulator with XRE-family HTH domain
VSGQVPSFGEQLRRHREAAGLMQEELAERAGLTAEAIGALERGKRQRPYPHTVRLFAETLWLTDAERAASAAVVPRGGAELLGHLVELARPGWACGWRSRRRATSPTGSSSCRGLFGQCRWSPTEESRIDDERAGTSLPSRPSPTSGPRA